MTDYWPDQDGRIFECFTVNCYADSTSITANYAVILGAGTTAGRFSVGVPAAASGDGIAVALKTPVAVGDMIPVLFSGVVKMYCAGGGGAASVAKCLVGSMVINSGTAGIIGIGTANSAQLFNASGSSHILGTALQNGTAAADEILVYVGRVF